LKYSKIETRSETSNSGNRSLAIPVELPYYIMSFYSKGICNLRDIYITVYQQLHIQVRSRRQDDECLFKVYLCSGRFLQARDVKDAVWMRANSFVFPAIEYFVMKLMAVIRPTSNQNDEDARMAILYQSAWLLVKSPPLCTNWTCFDYSANSSLFGSILINIKNLTSNYNNNIVTDHHETILQIQSYVAVSEICFV